MEIEPTTRGLESRVLKPRWRQRAIEWNETFGNTTSLFAFIYFQTAGFLCGEIKKPCFVIITSESCPQESIFVEL